jgi:uncharacterized protein
MAKRERPSLLRKVGKKAEEIVFCGSWARNFAYTFCLQSKPFLKKVSVDLNLEKDGFPPIRIAFVSDLHSGKMTHPDLIKEAGRILKKEEFDILLIGGDYIFLSADDIGLIVESFGPLSPRLGKFGVLGNHDRWINNEALLKKLDEAGIRILANEEMFFPSPFDFLSVYGLDDIEWGEPSFKNASKGKGKLRVLLSHSPESLSILGECRFDFALFGHTHAGQIAPPFGNPVLPFKDKYSKMFPYGFYGKGEKNEFLPLYVTSGLGCVWLPFRIFARSEVVIITLR